jgi:hypothetical protein
LHGNRTTAYAGLQSASVDFLFLEKIRYKNKVLGMAWSMAYALLSAVQGPSSITLIGNANFSFLILSLRIAKQLSPLQPFTGRRT